MKRLADKQNGILSHTLPLIKYGVLLVSMTLIYGCDLGGSAGTPENPEVMTLETELEPELSSSTLIINQPALEWSSCPEFSSLECATVLVPMDYSDPTGRTIEIAMARAPANPSTQQRTLLLNPGGPGGGGMGLLASLSGFADIPESIRSTFDFVSFDPRGIGRSTEIDCNTSVLFRQDLYPTSREEIEQVFSLSEQFAEDCFNTEGEYLQHLGSLNVVRDMNEMRKAMGLTEIDFLGYSYGTRLAALYLQIFPEHAGRFVLDGSMTPDPSVEPLVRGGLRPAQINIDMLAQACVGARITLCDPAEFSQQLQSRLDEVGSGPNTAELAILLRLLQFASTVPGFESFIVGGMANYLETGDVAELVFVFNFLGLGEAAENPGQFNLATFIAVLCADDFQRPTIDSLEAILPSHNAESDLFAELYLYTTGVCFGWPESIDPIPFISTNQAPPSLVIGGPTDAQTPLIFAPEMAAAVGGQFLRSDHDGHTTVFSGANQCTESAVEVFLTTGALPTTDHCMRSGAFNESFELASHWQDLNRQRVNRALASAP